MNYLNVFYDSTMQVCGTLSILNCIGKLNSGSCNLFLNMCSYERWDL